jgi:hypothetical protein
MENREIAKRHRAGEALWRNWRPKGAEFYITGREDGLYEQKTEINSITFSKCGLSPLLQFSQESSGRQIVPFGGADVTEHKRTVAIYDIG